jgi:hypothetical protein
MDIEPIEYDVSEVFSTYGVITAQRLFEKSRIKLKPEYLSIAIKHHYTFYYKMLQMPLINLLSGIILQQATDYHVYAQKLFIDYLLSGETGKGEETQGAETRASLEEARQELLTIGEGFHQLEGEHHATIALSQSALIQIAKEWTIVLDNTVKKLTHPFQKMQGDLDSRHIKDALDIVLVQCDIAHLESLEIQAALFELLSKKLQGVFNDELKHDVVSGFDELVAFTKQLDDKIHEHIAHCRDIANQARSYRTQFYDFTVRVLSLFQALPEYKVDALQDAINREPLYFDKTIGDLLPLE